MCKAGIPPNQILSALKQKNPHLQAVARTIYNMKAKIQLDSLGGRTLTQALFEELGQEGFTYNYSNDDDGHLTHVFFAHPKSITLSKAYSTVFVMDCTYKTNRYGMSLLDIVGMSSFNKSFYSCFAFLKKEKDIDYSWALQLFSKMLGDDSQPLVIVSDGNLALKKAIKTVFPNATHHLCVWHIQKNIVAKCKGHFSEGEDWDVFYALWKTIIYAETEEDFNESWHLLQAMYKNKKEIVKYIQQTWNPEKYKFVSAWTNKYLHFNNRASSRAEGAHAKLKRYLQVSTGNLREVKIKICLAVENELHEIKAQMESERLRVAHRYNVPYFKDIVAHVSIFALRELYKQYEMARLGTLKSVCTGHFSATMGLPCAHMMGNWSVGVLPLQRIHHQWRIDINWIISSSNENVANDDDEDDIKELLDKLYDMYKQWSSFLKREAKKKVYRILGMARPSIFEPRIQTRKRKSKAKKKKGHGSSSTRRDPSKFEIVEAEMDRATTQNVGVTSLGDMDLNMPPATI